MVSEGGSRRGMALTATYRLQLTPAFGFLQAREVLPYLKRLGISHVYLSPVTDARRGSLHGYDVVDHGRLRPELGGAEGFHALREAACGLGLGVVVDFVPNHAGAGPRNQRWQDVLRYGPFSPYADEFDIEWEPLSPRLRGKVLLPFLGRPYGEALDEGEIRVVWEDGDFRAAYGTQRFSLWPGTYGAILRLLGFGHLPLVEAFDALAREDRGRGEVLRAALREATRDLPPFRPLAGPSLHPILEQQFWRLSYWKTASSEVNYRRFFDVNELVAVRVELPHVFGRVHALLADLLPLPGVDGVRVDHVDGLADPHAYLRRLRDLGPRYVWVEKILGPGETLPAGWPVDGTTGYDFLSDVLGVLAWPAGEAPLDRLYRWYVRAAASFEEEAAAGKRAVMGTSLAGELSRLAHELHRLAEADYHTRDVTLEALRDALAELVAALPVYRTYLPYERARAVRILRQAGALARARRPDLDPVALRFALSVLLDPVPAPLEPRRARWTARFQQYTSAVAAKGVEDTAFYRHVRLVSHNEVGSSPERFALSRDAFVSRARFRARRLPRTLLATATHDHKRGEDVRMRLLVLAELPNEWRRVVRRLSHLAAAHRQPEGPTRRDEYLFFQTLVALWVGTPRDELERRVAAYMQKAAREAKLRTSWLYPDVRYERALDAFVRGFLHDPRLPDAVGPFAEVVARYGFRNTLSQVVLKMTAPGVPDVYQGCELLDLSLVDPDNRRPVDFRRRARLLDELRPVMEAPDATAVRALLDGPDHDRAKLYVVAKLLDLRATHPAPFSGAFRALRLRGAGQDHVLAYEREGAGQRVAVVVGRWFAVLDRSGGWADTAIELPPGTWQDVLTGASVPGGWVPVDRMPVPWAVLVRTARGRRGAERRPPPRNAP